MTPAATLGRMSRMSCLNVPNVLHNVVNVNQGSMDTKQKAHLEGITAGSRAALELAKAPGCRVAGNPYPYDTPENDEWARGFQNGLEFAAGWPDDASGDPWVIS